MAGYRRSKTIVLEFAGDEYEGLVVRARSTSVAGILGLLDMVSLFDRTDRKYSSEEMKGLDRLFRALAGCPDECVKTHPELAEVGLVHYQCRITEWNLEEEDGTPIRPGYAGLMGQDFDFAVAITEAWLEGVVGTPAPLDGKSPGGAPFPEGSIPMEASLPGLPD